MIYSLYKITFPNNKVYIGITSRQLYYRKAEHRARHDSNLPIHNALRKYKDQETWQIIYQSKEKQDIYEKEQYFISFYKSNEKSFGYNLTNGGEGIIEYKFSEEQKRQNSERKKDLVKNKPGYKEFLANNLKKYYNENPNARKENATKQFKTSESRKLHGEKLKQHYAKHGFNGGKKQFPIKLVNNTEELTFKSVNDASKFLKCDKSAISNVIHGRSKTVRGYTVIKLNGDHE